jgi:hypothetical protein
MMALLSPRVWLALACAVFFAGCNFASYRAGKAHTQAAWNIEKLATAAAVLTAADAARTREQALQATVKKAENDSKQRETNLVADTARVAAVTSSLRKQLATARSDLSSASDASARKYAAALSDVFGECTAKYSEVARSADGYASDSLMYQQGWPK